MSARKSAATKKGGLRAALAAKTTRTVAYEIPLVSAAEADRIGERLSRINGQLELARLRKEPQVIERLEEEQAQVRAERDACFHRVEFAGLHPNDWDVFLSAHQPKDGADDDEKKAADDQLFYDLIVASVVDGDGMTADEWREVLADKEHWTARDVQAFRRAVFEAQEREFSDGIPKG